MKHSSFEPGDRVVYRKTKHSNSPGPRAQSVTPARYGDDYGYVVEKFWVVVATRDDQVIIQTRRGKQHEVSANSPNLRRAGFWDLLFNRHRFPNQAESGWTSPG